MNDPRPDILQDEHDASIAALPEETVRKMVRDLALRLKNAQPPEDAEPRPLK